MSINSAVQKKHSVFFQWIFTDINFQRKHTVTPYLYVKIYFLVRCPSSRTRPVLTPNEFTTAVKKTLFAENTNNPI